MRTRFTSLTPLGVAAFALLVLTGMSPGGAVAQPPREGNSADEAALVKNAEAFVAAFKKGDSKALAELWSPEGDFTDLAGNRLVGREAIAESYAELFAENEGLELRIESTGLRFVTPDVAIEDGTTAVIYPDGMPPSETRYTIVHAKKDGKWYLNSVREAPFTPPSNFEHLKGLAWLIGEWVDDVDQGAAARISFDWTDTQNFIVCDFTTTIKGMSIGGGTSWIGWDPNRKSVRSWMFESTGGFGEGTWVKDGAAWTSSSTAVLADGRKATSTNVVTRVGPDTLTWAVTKRTLDGEALPDIEAVTMKRVPLRDGN